MWVIQVMERLREQLFQPNTRDLRQVTERDSATLILHKMMIILNLSFCLQIDLKSDQQFQSTTTEKIVIEEMIAKKLVLIT
jgi:hypothetical protein